MPRQRGPTLAEYEKNAKNMSITALQAEISAVEKEEPIAFEDKTSKKLRLKILYDVLEERAKQEQATERRRNSSFH